MTFPALGRADSWSGVRAVVIGFDADGRSAADNLLHLGAEVTVIDPEPDPSTQEFADLLGVLGADIRRGPALGDAGNRNLVVVTGSPSTGAALRLVRDANPAAPVVSTLDLARRLDPDQVWLVVGAAGAEDEQAARVAQGAASMLRAGGVAAAPAGGPMPSAVELVMEPQRYEALVVVATGDLLEVSGSLRPQSACVLRAADGLGHVFTDVERACVYRTQDLATEEMVREAEVIEGARAIGITVGTPGLSMLGVVDDVLCDRAFIEDRRSSAAEICTLGDLRDGAASTVEAVLAAAALARAYGVALAPIRHAISETF